MSASSSTSTSTTPDAEPSVRHFPGADGLPLAYYELGEGRPVVLLHGLFSNAWTNWIRYGHAARIAANGFRVIMPDLRAHGRSAAPHDPAAYPPDILTADGEALLRHLGLTDYDLGGYSLGARTTVRMLVRGATPRRAVIAGMGLSGLFDIDRRTGFFRAVLRNAGSHRQGSEEWMAEAFLKTTGGDAGALLLLLDSFVDSERDDVARIATPALVLCGAQDGDNGSAAELARFLPHGRLAEVRGNHMNVVTRADFGLAIADFLSA